MELAVALAALGLAGSLASAQAVQHESGTAAYQDTLSCFGGLRATPEVRYSAELGAHAVVALELSEAPAACEGRSVTVVVHGEGGRPLARGAAAVAAGRVVLDRAADAREVSAVQVLPRD